jgi:hypothetical protein
MRCCLPCPLGGVLSDRGIHCRQARGGVPARRVMKSRLAPTNTVSAARPCTEVVGTRLVGQRPRHRVEKTESQRVTFATEWQREAWLQVRSIRGGALPSNMVDFTSSSDASTLTAADDVLVRWVRADQLLSVRRSVRAVVPSGMAVGLAAAGVALYSSASSTEPLAWLLLVVLSNAFRAFVCRSVRASERSPGGLDELGIAGQLRLVTLSSFLSGCVWALLCSTLFFLTVVCGICAGSVTYGIAYAPGAHQLHHARAAVGGRLPGVCRRLRQPRAGAMVLLYLGRWHAARCKATRPSARAAA